MLQTEVHGSAKRFRSGSTAGRQQLIGDKVMQDSDSLVSVMRVIHIHDGITLRRLLTRLIGVSQKSICNVRAPAATGGHAIMCVLDSCVLRTVVKSKINKVLADLGNENFRTFSLANASHLRKESIL